jgi:hypothetical protein
VRAWSSAPDGYGEDQDDDGEALLPTASGQCSNFRTLANRYTDFLMHVGPPDFLHVKPSSPEQQ